MPLPAAVGLGLKGLSILGVGATALPFIDGSAGRAVREDILSQKFVERGQKDIKQNWYQRLLSGKTDEELTNMVYEDISETAYGGKRGSELSDMERVLGKKWDPRKQSATQFLNKNFGAYTTKKEDNSIEKEIKLSQRLDQLPSAIREREKESRRYYDNLRAQQQTRRDALRIDEQRLDLQRQQQHNEMIKHNRELQLHREDKRRDQWLAVASGLSALGGAFAM